MKRTTIIVFVLVCAAIARAGWAAPCRLLGIAQARAQHAGAGMLHGADTQRRCLRARRRILGTGAVGTGKCTVPDRHGAREKQRDLQSALGPAAARAFQ